MDAELKLARGAILTPLKIQFLSKNKSESFYMYGSLKILKNYFTRFSM